MFDDWMHEGEVYKLVKDPDEGTNGCKGCAFFDNTWKNCPTEDYKVGKRSICIKPDYTAIWVEKDTNAKLKSDMLLPTDAQERKQIPITTGVLDYFPLAIAEVAKCSWAGNQQHHPDKELHWDKTKSTDHSDCIARHLIDRGKFDTDGQRHSAKLAWRALALLQLELEEETKKGN